MSVNEKMTAIADAIRAKTGGTEMLTLEAMANAIAGIQAGGGGDGQYAALLDGTITVATDASATSIRYYAFKNCIRLTTASFPAATSIGSSAFQGCTNLTSISFPAATNIGSNAFDGCIENLTSVNFPVATSIGSSAFKNCSRLTTASFPAATSIGSNAFASCGRLTTFVLGGSSLCTLRGSNAFSYTPIFSGTGYIYVPSSLVASYKAATNWVYFSNQISAIEDSEFA